MIKLGSFGNLIWEKVYGGEHFDIPRSVIPLADGYLLTAYTWDDGTLASDIYLLKIDRQGEKVFEHTYGTPSLDAGHRVIKANDGGFFILGYTRGIEPRGDFILIKTDSLGNELWRQNYGINLDDVAHGLYQDAEGNILIFGSFASFCYGVHYNFQYPAANMVLIQTDQNGNEQWRRIYMEDGHDFGFDIKPAFDGGYYLFGSSQGYGADSFDMLLTKVGGSGYVQWRHLYGGNEYEYGLSMDVNENNELFLFGTTKTFGYNGSADCYLVKTDAEGNIIWQTTIGGNEADYGNAVVATSDGGCAVIGTTNSFGNGEQDILFVKLDKNGAIEDLLSNFYESLSENALVFPNPASQSAKAKLPKGPNPYRIEIVSMKGNFIRTSILKPPDYQFSVEQLPAGLYFYRISSTDTSEQNLVGKLVVK